MLKLFVHKATLAGFGVLCLVALAGSSVSAVTFAKTTYLKFSGTVVVPGAELPAGEYIFELADSDTSRTVVRVSDRRRARTFAQVLTRRTSPRRSGLAATVTFGEAASGAPRQIVAWYPAGESTGYEFIY